MSRARGGWVIRCRAQNLRKPSCRPRIGGLGHLCGFGFSFGTRKVQGEEPLQNLFIAQISGPAVGGGIEFLVRQVKPGGALVVEIRERALFQLGGAIGVAWFKARI